MLFITNRMLKQSHRSRRNRKVTFDLDNNEASQSVFFCRRDGPDDYTEIGGTAFLEDLRGAGAEQLLIYIHGFNNLPEPDTFPRAARLQQLFDASQANLVQVVPIIWPTDNDRGILHDYFDDQMAADASGIAYARVLEMLRAWQQENMESEKPCLKRLNVLAHSMGARVLREGLHVWCRKFLRNDPPMLFRNVLMPASDVVNETLEDGQDGRLISIASKNTVVYFASDDLALRASKAANLRNGVASRRLGHSGPEDMSKVARNVFSVDCDSLNTKYDFPTGHTYFLTDDAGNPGRVFEHMFQCVSTGIVDPPEKLIAF